MKIREAVMKIHLDEVIEELRRNLLQMANMVNEAIVYSTRALFEKDENLAKSVVEKDTMIDMMENKLDEESLKIFALQQPIAVDLRFVVMVLKMNNDFERIGDMAVNISERVIDFIQNDYYVLFSQLGNYQELKYMAAKANEMIDKTLQCIIEKDTHLARDVIKMDNLVDSYNKSMIMKCIAEISDKPDKAEFFISLISISKNLERVGDHCTNICQDTIYMIEGKNIKHQPLS
ncbi:MAG TPA: phosphate transport system regulatory protein PhoU [Spirochaetia bacterium]|nr:phosphate transport system regulatory protein PhoU [Spirochaetia bacterium]